jgi:hypothetical protein
LRHHDDFHEGRQIGNNEIVTESGRLGAIRLLLKMEGSHESIVTARGIILLTSSKRRTSLGQTLQLSPKQDTLFDVPKVRRNFYIRTCPSP